MTWQARTRQMAYTSPSGVRFVFDFEKADREFDKNTSGFNFPGVSGTYVQDLGHTDGRYPTRAIFWGDAHDLEAAAFRTALSESGRGRLEHPRDGLVDVVPFGKIKFREDLVKEANQTIIEVEFWESTIVLYPSGTTDPGGQVLNSVFNTLLESATIFADTIQIVSAVNKANLRNRFESSVGIIRSVLGEVVSADAVNFREFTTVADSIISDINELISTPQTLADQLNILLQIPANSTATIGSKTDGYNTVIETFTNSNNPDAQLRSTINDFRNDELFAVGSVASLITSSINATFNTRSESVTAAANVVSQFDAVNVWREINYAGLS